MGGRYHRSCRLSILIHWRFTSSKFQWLCHSCFLLWLVDYSTMLAQRLFQGNLRRIVRICRDHADLWKLINVPYFLFGSFLITSSWRLRINSLSHFSALILSIYHVLRSDRFESLWCRHISFALLKWDSRFYSFHWALWPKTTYIVNFHVIEVLAWRNRSAFMVLRLLLWILILVLRD